MDLQVQWFAYEAVRNGMVTGEICREIAELPGTTDDLLAFAQVFIDNGLCEDFALIQDLVYQADSQAKSGQPPPLDIFSVTTASEPEPEPVARPEPEAAPAPVPVAPSAPVEMAVPGAAAVSALSDSEARDQMLMLLSQASALGASDLHVSAGAPLFARICRQIKPLADDPLDAEAAERLVFSVLTEAEAATLRKTGDLDIALGIDENTRFRVNLMRQKEGYAGTFRLVPSTIRSLADLGLANPKAITKLLDHHNGLILVTGPVGAGKTTTLATLVDLINAKRADHVICVEDPVEIVHHSKKCNVTQREVGQHTASFQSALKGALRQDPDVIVIGELRDLTTIEMAITAAETGHLVIGTLHTSDATTTLGRLLDVFPPAQQAQIRAMTSESLRGVVCQKLIPTVDGGVAAACEILINTIAVASMIRDARTHQLRSVMETGVALGMCTMDSSIWGLYTAGRVSAEVARAYMDEGEFDKMERQREQAAAAAEQHGAGSGKKRRGWLR